MKLLSLKLLSVLTSPVRAVVGSPEIKSDNKPDINLTLLAGNQVKILLIPETPPVKTCRLGNHLEDVVEQEAEAGEVNPDVVPALLGIRGSINDNYCVPSPVAVARPNKSVLNVERQNFSVSTSCVMSCCQSCTFCLKCERAVTKDTSPSLKMKQEIKLVKDAFSVDHCVFAPVVPNAHFYCVNTSYPMDNCFTGRHDRSRQTSEKDVLYILPAGPVTECAFARWRMVLHFLFTY